ncbi:hypothetical protein B0J17DRAFT_411793 [Rhizoctonia solani]|nr:hypothetical protein B0J17DRAFT_411793 [Rhizoctonia solani]
MNPVCAPPRRSSPIPRRPRYPKRTKLTYRLTFFHRFQLLARFKNANCRSAGFAWGVGGNITSNPPGLLGYGHASSNLGSANGGVIWSGQGPGSELYSELEVSDGWLEDPFLDFTESILNIPSLQPRYHGGDDLFGEQLSYAPLPPFPLSITPKPHRDRLEWDIAFVTAHMLTTCPPEVSQFGAPRERVDPTEALGPINAPAGIDLYATLTTPVPSTYSAAHSHTTPQPSTNEAASPQSAFRLNLSPGEPQSSDYKSGWNAGFIAGCELIIGMLGESQSGMFRSQADSISPLVQNLLSTHTAAHSSKNIISTLQPNTNIDNTITPLPSTELSRNPVLEVTDSQSHPQASTNTYQVASQNDTPIDARLGDDLTTPEWTPGSNDPSASLNAIQPLEHGHDKRKHQCDVCNKRFHRKYQLEDHMHRHRGQARGKLRMPNFGIVNSNYRTYEAHSCDFPGCGKSFTTRANMRRHQKIHERATHGDNLAGD